MDTRLQDGERRVCGQREHTELMTEDPRAFARAASSSAGRLGAVPKKTSSGVWPRHQNAQSRLMTRRDRQLKRRVLSECTRLRRSLRVLIFGWIPSRIRPCYLDRPGNSVPATGSRWSRGPSRPTITHRAASTSASTFLNFARTFLPST